MSLLTALVLAVLAVVAATLFHYQALEMLARRATGLKHRESRALPIVLALLLVHLAEILLFALVYALATGPLHLGELVGDRGPLTALAYFYYSAETYSTLGYGDIGPVGDLRLIASVEPLVGLLLLAWSGSFLFSLVQKTVRPPS